MLLTWIDKIGDWNPQLLREFKGRLNVQNVMIAVTSSLISQGLLLLYFWGQLPSEEKSDFSYYCVKQISLKGGDQCGLDASGHILINWPSWWHSIFSSLSWLPVFALLLSGMYLLISDLAQEERRGTLNFVRLSPQSSQSILIGKLLGVPILPSIAIALAAPLHLFTAWEAGISTVHVWEIYILTGSIALFFYSTSLLLGILARFPAWLGAGTFLFACFILYILLGKAGWADLTAQEWFGLPLWIKPEISLTFILISLGIATYWIWRALHRRFHSPSAGLLSKRQSYWMTASFQMFIIGFFLLNQDTYREGSSALRALLIGANILWFLALTLAISPHRQALLDWSRYRRDNAKSQNHSLVQDLLWHEKSPASLAITINLLISAIGLSLWISFWPNSEEKVHAFLGVFFSMSIFFMYSVIIQMLLFVKTRRPLIWAMGTVGAMMVLPILALNILSLWPGNLPGLWLFSALPMLAVAHASTMTLLLGFLGHVGSLGWLIFQLTKQLQKAGESNSKALFADLPRLNSARDVG